MIPSRRWLLVPLAAACAFLLSGTAVSQETSPKGDRETKQAEKAASPGGASEKEVADLKKAIEARDKEVADLKKAVLDLKESTATATKAAETAKVTAQQARTGLDAAAKQYATKDDLAALPKPGAGMEEAKKAIEEAKKAGTDADGKAVEGQKRGDTAWLLAASALVFFMVPGLALFYGGMVRRKNVLATMMQSMAALAVVGLYWIAVGYSLAFGPSALKVNLLGVEDGGLIGWDWNLVFLKGVKFDDYLPAYNIPVNLHVMFQGMFAIITPALISGAVAERIRFWPFCLFMLLWVTFVYCPLAHMVWAYDFFDPTVLATKRGASAIGLLGKMGALDFAGGTVVHIAAGMAGLAACLAMRKRIGYPQTITHPNSIVLTLLGAGLLWFGWFGFNGGSALSSTAQAVSAFTATQAATAAAGLMWMLVEWLHKGKPTALGLASGIVAGLVAVTPASGYVYAWGGVAIGASAAVVCYLAVTLKGILGYDDSLDAFGVHGVGGFVGAVLTGVFCTTAIYPAGGDGPFAYKYHRARFAEIEKELPAAESAAAEAAKAVKAAEAELKKVPSEAKDKVTDAEKALADAKDVAADKTATVDGLKAEKDKLKATIDKQDDVEHDGKDKKTPYSQLTIQFKAAGFSVAFAFVISLILVVVTQAVTLGNFTTSKKAETEGLDRTEHGEVGFDFGLATESVPVVGVEPRAATAPRGNGRFELAIEGVDPGELRKVWTSLCQPSDAPADPDFLAVYPHVTTIGGGRFRFRGGDPAAVATRLQSLLKKQLPGKPVKVARI